MPDKIVYVHANHASDTVTIITPKAYDALLEEGWEIVSSRSRRIDGKMVEQVQLRRREANRAVARVPDPAEEPAARRSLSVLGEDSPTRSSGALVPRGVAAGGGSFLGAGSDFAGLPGIAAAGSVVIQHAFAMGTDAERAGQDEGSCPWPPGTAGATQWLRGFRAARKEWSSGGDPTGGAYLNGRASAQGDADLEVHCPYPEGTPHYHEWLRGFKDAGGRVEGP